MDFIFILKNYFTETILVHIIATGFEEINIEIFLVNGKTFLGNCKNKTPTSYIT